MGGLHLFGGIAKLRSGFGQELKFGRDSPFWKGFPRMDIKELRYTKSHEWVAVEGDNATIGITDFAVKELTDLVFIELPEVGSTITAGGSFGEVESVKAVSDLLAPITGEVTEVNETLPDNLALLSDDPFGKGWVARVKITDAASVDSLLDHAAYEAHCADGH